MTTFLTSQELQELINVDRSTVYRMAEDGRLPGVKVGRQWRFPADQVYERFGLPGSRGAPATGGAPDGSLARLLRPEVAQSIADLIGEMFGVMAVVTEMDGRAITSVANPCGYYAAVADQPGAAEACLAEWRLFASEPHVAPRFVATHLGFLCARTFVWVDLKPVGMIVVGGVRPPVWPPAAERVEAIADAFGVSRELLLESVEHTWVLDTAEQRRVLQLLPQMGDLVSQLATARGHLLDAHHSAHHSFDTPQGGERP